MILSEVPAGNLPIRPFFDSSDIGSEADWRHRILHGLRHSKVLLVCLSPNYFASDNCRWEWEHFLRRQGSRNLRGDGEAIQAVLFTEIAENHASHANWFASVRRSNTQDLSTWYTMDPQLLIAPGDARAVGLSIVTTLKKCVLAARQSLAREYGNLRAANSHFVGRQRQLRELHDAIGVGKLGVVTALHGLGGIGKTELAVQYANEYARSFTGGIWWINAARFGESASQKTPDLLKQAIASLADHWSVPANIGQSLDAQFDFVVGTLRGASSQRRSADSDGTAQVLIVLDNVETPAMLGANQRNIVGNCPWLSLLATTRDASAEWQRADDIQVIPLDGLDPEDGLALVREWQQGNVFRDDADAEAAKTLVESLGYYTLAVEQAAIYVGLRPEISIASFLDKFREEGLAELDTLTEGESELQNAMQHREKQLRLVLKQTLPSPGSLALQILHYAALFDPDAIGKPWIEALIEQHHRDQNNTQSFAEAWRWLEHRRLVTPTDVAEVWRMHRLVCGHLKDLFDLPIERFNAQIAKQVSALRTQTISAQSMLWFLNVLVAWMKQLSDKHPLWGGITSFLLSTYVEAKKFNLVNQIIEPALAYLESLHRENPRTPKHARAYANALEISAFIQHGMGDYGKAISLGQEVLALRESLVRSLPDVSSYVDELSRSQAYFGSSLAELNKLSSADAPFRNSVLDVSSYADEIMNSLNGAYVHMSEASGVFARQLNEIRSFASPMQDAINFQNRFGSVADDVFRNATPNISSLSDEVSRAAVVTHIPDQSLKEVLSSSALAVDLHIEQNAPLQRSLAGVTNFCGTRNYVGSVFDDIQKQFGVFGNINLGEIGRSQFPQFFGLRTLREALNNAIT